MSPSLRRYGRGSVLAVALLAGAFALGYTPSLAFAQEMKCYLMVCTGSVCIANQIDCPKTDPQKPAPPP